MYTNSCVSLMLAVLLTTVAAGQDEYAKRVAAKASEIQDGWRVRAGSDRQLEEDALVYVVHTTEDSRLKANALLELGNYDAHKSLHTLRRNMTFNRAMKSRTFGPLVRFPAARALVQVGSKARDAIIEGIGGDYLDYELEIMAHILLEIDGDPRVAAFRLTLEMERTLWTVKNPDFREDRLKNMRKIINFLNEENFKMKRLPEPPEDLEERLAERDGNRFLPD